MNYPCVTSGYILIDNMSPTISIVSPILQITSPLSYSNQLCSFMVSGTTDSIPVSVQLQGRFTGSPANATLLTDSAWQVSLTYPSSYSGNDTIIASGSYAFGYTARDTVIVAVNCPDTSTIVIPNLITPNGDGVNDFFEIKNLPARSPLKRFPSMLTTSLSNY